jgi:hypothetical protein
MTSHRKTFIRHWKTIRKLKALKEVIMPVRAYEAIKECP